MGGHGGLNILPQKKWNVYNFDNREKVRLDEEAAAKEEHIQRQQSRKRDHDLRLQELRKARGLPTRPNTATSPPSAPAKPVAVVVAESESLVAEQPSNKHMNLFEGIRIFDPITVDEKKRKERDSEGKYGREKKVRKEEVRVVGPEDEVYRLGYGVAGKGVKLPWYLEKKDEKRKVEESDDDEEEYRESKKSGGKKSIEELREERLKREGKEKERERALVMGKSRRDGGFSSRRR